jgi:maltodextrin utilization protein YvdJ
MVYVMREHKGFWWHVLRAQAMLFGYGALIVGGFIALVLFVTWASTLHGIAALIFWVSVLLLIGLVAGIISYIMQDL